MTKRRRNTPQRIKRPATRKGRFAVRALDVVLGGSAAAKNRVRAHVVGRPFTNYLIPEFGPASFDAIVKRLSNGSSFEKRRLCMTLSKCGLVGSFRQSQRKIVEYDDEDRAARTTAARRALRALSELVYAPGFISAIGFAAPILAAKNPSFSDQALELTRALDKITILEVILADAQRHLKPTKRQNPGRPYMAGFAESLVAFWSELTGELPSKTRKTAKRSQSRRALFWCFLDAAMQDLLIKDQPIDFQVREAINRRQRV